MAILAMAGMLEYWHRGHVPAGIKPKQTSNMKLKGGKNETFK